MAGHHSSHESVCVYHLPAPGSICSAGVGEPEEPLLSLPPWAPPENETKDMRSGAEDLLPWEADDTGDICVRSHLVPM